MQAFLFGETATNLNLRAQVQPNPSPLIVGSLFDRLRYAGEDNWPIPLDPTPQQPEVRHRRDVEVIILDRADRRPIDIVGEIV
jgi:hypothetical protein